MQITSSQALEAAASAWYGSNIRSARGERLRVPADALQLVSEAATQVVEANSAQSSRDGRAVDVLAPSVGHAACFMVAANLLGRMIPGSYSDLDLIDSTFGDRPVYRGQARPWHLRPTGWRRTFPTDRAIAAMRGHIGKFMTAEDAIELDLIGRPENDSEFAGLAQHYGVPTSLVDFTFDPLIALLFACAADHVAFDEQSVPPDHAVIYTTTLAKLVTVRNVIMHFPPLQARRLYRQHGLFVDFGALPAGGAVDFEVAANWTAVEQSCVRIFVPREYPIAIEMSALRIDDVLTTDVFFEQVCNAANEFATTALSVESAPSFMAERVKERPPWRVKHLDRSFFYVDDEFVAAAGVLERYLSIAAAIQVEKRVRLDPFVVFQVAENDQRLLLSLLQVSRLPGGSGRQFEWIVDEIAAALRFIKSIREEAGL
ncbi:MAG TPA: FRG domain-containing protein [Thermoanaerobaculia bacterium]|nr:FRG domain-containing protein [Thermoanaerobaculia bacterium]